MKRLVLALIFTIFSICNIFPQKKVETQKNTPKQIVKKPVSATKPAQVLREISAQEWRKISEALQSENWENSSVSALQSLQKLAVENAKKQVAQLRYIYLYSLAGKVSEGKMPFEELEKKVRNFIGKDFLPVSRQFLEDCTSKVNYICPQKDSDKILRVTATNKLGNTIHFFEYYKLNEPFKLSENIEKVGFVGGRLSKIEIATHQNNTKILRLIFENSYIKIATD